MNTQSYNYKPGRQCIHIRKEGQTSRHAVVFIYGGAWVFGSPNAILDAAKHLPYNAFLPEYKVANTSFVKPTTFASCMILAVLSMSTLPRPVIHAITTVLVLALLGYMIASAIPRPVFPENVTDIADAVKWIHRNREVFQVDSISLIGHSAGAHLVSVVVTNPRLGLPTHFIQAWCCVSGLYMYENIRQLHFYKLLQPFVFNHGTKPLINFDECSIDDDNCLNQAIKSAQITNAWPFLEQDSLPPALLLVSGADFFMVDECIKFYKVLQSQGHSVEMEQFTATTHLSIMKYWGNINRLISQRIIKFLEAVDHTE